jgi:Family of unknown function (DUF5906)
MSAVKKTFEATEIPDINKLKIIRDNWDALKLSNQKYIIKGVEYEPKEILTKYIKKYKNGGVPVKYFHSKKAQTFGRQYAEGALSLQSLSRCIRHTASVDHYIDYDFTNCHPTILLQYCEKKGYACDDVKYYINNRDKCLAKIIEHNPGYTRDAAKTVFLSLLNGGNSDYDKLKKVPRFLERFKDQVLKIQEAILQNVDNAKLIGIIGKDKKQNLKGSLMNHILCDIENRLLMTCVEYMKGEEINIRNIVLVFDGWMLPAAGSQPNIPSMEAYVQSKTEYSMKIIIKPFDEVLNLTGLVPHNAFEDFESTHCKIMNPFCYIRETAHELPLIVDHGTLVNMYRHLEPTDCKTPFISGWTTSPTIRTYETCELLPHPLKVPGNTYNLWKGWDIPSPNTGDPEPFFTHIRNILSTTEQSDWLINWIACIFQSPGLRTDICPILIGGAGCGKGFIFEKMVGKLMGKYFMHTESPENDIFARFSEGRNCKILVNVDDFNVGEMKMKNDPFKSLITGERMSYEAKGKPKIDTVTILLQLKLNPMTGDMWYCPVATI